MVRTDYPAVLKSVGKAHVLIATLFCFMPFINAMYMGHLSWKLGKVPRMTHHDQKYIKFVYNKSWREKFIFRPALEAYGDRYNIRENRKRRDFLKKKATI